MPRTRLMLLPVALLFAAGSARAQRYDPVQGRGAARGEGRIDGRDGSRRESRQAPGGAWNGTASQWGGSPIEPRRHDRSRLSYVLPFNAYIPDAMIAPYTDVPAPPPPASAPDTVFVAVPVSPVEMPVVTTRREQPQLTTMDVYRQQRFAKP